MPHRKEQAVKPAMEMMKYLLRPSRSASQPDKVSTMALATR